MVLLELSLLLFTCTSSIAQWQWTSHGRQPVDTGMAYMKSGSGNPKLFGVGDGELQERHWSGSAWVWTNHGSPSLSSEERLASKPCVLKDGKLFVITNKGNMWERHWTGTAWAWTWHGKAHGNVAIKHTTCTCTNVANIARVFVVGTDLKLYERYWSGSAWQWRTHGTPRPGVSLLAEANIDSCNSCTHTLVYVVGSDGRLYRLHVSKWSNPGTATWHSRLSPTGKSVRSVTIGDDGTIGVGTVYITTQDNKVCRHYSPYTYYCYGNPPDSINVAISKVIPVTNCPALTSGSAEYVFMHSWDPKYQRKSRLYALRVTGVNQYSYHFIDNIGKHDLSYVDSPVVWMSGTFPKLFSVNSQGYVDEHFIN